MEKHGISNLRRELERLRSRKYNLKLADLVRFAKKIGRKRDTSRGREPTYVSVVIPGARPLSIPGHKKVNPHTANSVMDSFEADLDQWEDILEEQGGKINEERKRLPPATIRTDRNSGGTR